MSRWNNPRILPVIVERIADGCIIDLFFLSSWLCFNLEAHLVDFISPSNGRFFCLFFFLFSVSFFSLFFSFLFFFFHFPLGFLFILTTTSQRCDNQSTTESRTIRQPVAPYDNQSTTTSRTLRQPVVLGATTSRTPSIYILIHIKTLIN